MKIIKTVLLSFIQAIGMLLFGSFVTVFMFGGAAAVLVVLYYIVLRLTT